MYRPCFASYTELLFLLQRRRRKPKTKPRGSISKKLTFTSSLVATGLPGAALAQPELARPRCLRRPRPGFRTPAQPGAEGTPAHAGNGRAAGLAGTGKSPAQPGTKRRRPGRDFTPRWPSRKAPRPAARRPRPELERASPAGSHPAPAQAGCC
jgi:hypothetical protein